MALVDGDATGSNELVNGELLAPAGDGLYPAWMVPPTSDKEPNPPYDYVVNFVQLHKHGFTAPASRFMRGLCHYYGVELHNFAPNAISQAASFVAVYEGYLGIPANWDLWVHLFRGELHTLAMGEKGTRRAVRTGGLTLALWDTRKELYPLCTMTSNNANWEKGWFYCRNDGVGLPPYTGKVLIGKTSAWHHGVLPPSRQWRLESLTSALRYLADTRLGVASIIANFHHRRIVPLMERELCIFEMSDAANPMSLACSRLLQERFPKEYAATRARHAINRKSFVMLPDTQPVSTVFISSLVLFSHFLLILTVSVCSW
jgi:hypothetical protein